MATQYIHDVRCKKCKRLLFMSTVKDVLLKSEPDNNCPAQVRCGRCRTMWYIGFKTDKQKDKCI